VNPYTGDLLRITATDLAAAQAQGFQKLPISLQVDAEAILGQQERVRIDLRKRGPLQDWAKKKRKAKIAAKSRRENRRG
jgi:hypothetical protein